MGTIADLIEYRSLHEHSVAFGESHEVATEWGPFKLHTFRDTIDVTLHFALQRGDLAGEQPVPVRVQSIDLLRDIFGTQLGDGRGGWSYRSAMAHVAEQNRGVVVLVGQASSSEQVLTDVHQFLSSGEPPPRPQNYRLIGTGAQILRHLGIQRMALLSAPLRFNALSGFNLEVTEFLTPEN